ncbi:MAG: helix-turn-helix transcriptional regulator, partial [Actinomycetota bacterium]|nr:helix-turn-helix transcriptional regulator [Actinomycetota bacterium]
MAASPGPLGEYLRARRDARRPEDVGLPQGRRRRVAGLRRDEVAVLAGISAEYVTRLEQGRDRHPSVEVLDALAAVPRAASIPRWDRSSASRPSAPASASS